MYQAFFKLIITFAVTAGELHLHTLHQNTANDLVGTIFSEYNEDVEVLQTGLVILLEDDTFYFNDSTLGLDCTNGYIRPVVLNRVKTELGKHNVSQAYRTEVIMRNVSIIYKDCRVSKESPEFQDAVESSPCFLRVDIQFLIGWVAIATQRPSSTQTPTNDTCRYYLDLNTDEQPFGVGLVELFFLPTATFHRFPLQFDEVWTDKVRDAINRMSIIVLAGVPCREIKAKGGDMTVNQKTQENKRGQ